MDWKKKEKKSSKKSIPWTWSLKDGTLKIEFHDLWNGMIDEFLRTCLRAGYTQRVVKYHFLGIIVHQVHKSLILKLISFWTFNLRHFIALKTLSHKKPIRKLRLRN
jgi:hypothetical protein